MQYGVFNKTGKFISTNLCFSNSECYKEDVYGVGKRHDVSHIVNILKLT